MFAQLDLMMLELINILKPKYINRSKSKSRLLGEDPGQFGMAINLPFSPVLLVEKTLAAELYQEILAEDLIPFAIKRDMEKIDFNFKLHQDNYLEINGIKFERKGFKKSLYSNLKDEEGLINAIFKFNKILDDEKCMSYIKLLKKVNYLIKKKLKLVYLEKEIDGAMMRQRVQRGHAETGHDGFFALTRYQFAPYALGFCLRMLDHVQSVQHLGHFHYFLHYALLAQISHGRDQVSLGRNLSVQHPLPFSLLVRLFVNGVIHRAVIFACQIASYEVGHNFLLVFAQLQVGRVLLADCAGHCGHFFAINCERFAQQASLDVDELLFGHLDQLLFFAFEKIDAQLKKALETGHYQAGELFCLTLVTFGAFFLGF
ncbi:hypothetical protein BpHYR1_032514 [Brachionus plicatilis]|uniref:Uncharacterized protein n=1 Tax=Brachionus plicatilis TaxID=10195 RepID=A0A3M7Q455_BRAPC|nr:hypothetical protein BpHYR1_032514 [Brachionus plicatilis]